MTTPILIGDIPLAQADPRVAVAPAFSTAAAALGTAGQLGGEILQGIQEGRAVRDVRQVGQALSQVEASIAEEERAGALGESPEIDQYRRQVEGKARKHFDAIRSDMEQTDRRGTAAIRARMLAEKEIRSISGMTPGFSREIRAAASEVLGFDPTGETMSRLFNMQDPQQETEVSNSERLKDMLGQLHNTDLGRAMEADMISTGRSPEEVIATYRENGALQTAHSNYTMSIAWESGQLSTQKAMSQYMKNIGTVTAPGPIIKGFVQQAQTGGFETLDKNMALLELSRLESQLVDAFVGNAPENAVITDADLTQLTGQVRNRLMPYRELVENSDAFEALQQNVDKLGLLTDMGLYQEFPDLMILNRLQPGLASTVLDLQIKAAGNEDRLNLMSAHFPLIDSLRKSEGVDRVKNLIAGRIPAMMGAGGVPEHLTTGNADLDRQLDLAAGAMVIEDNGMADKNISEYLRNNMPKFTLSKIAKNPEISDQMSTEDRAKWRTSYIAQLYQNIESIANDPYRWPAGARIEYDQFGQAPGVGDERERSARGTMVLVDHQGNRHYPRDLARLNNIFAPLAESTDLPGVSGAHLAEVVNKMAQLADIKKQLSGIADRVSAAESSPTTGEVSGQGQRDSVLAMREDQRSLVTEGNRLVSEIHRLQATGSSKASPSSSSRLRWGETGTASNQQIFEALGASEFLQGGGR